MPLLLFKGERSQEQGITARLADKACRLLAAPLVAVHGYHATILLRLLLSVKRHWGHTWNAEATGVASTARATKPARRPR